MAKAPKKKSTKKASNTFHSIMAASLKGNPKPNNKVSKPIKNTDVIEHREGGDLSMR